MTGPEGSSAGVPRSSYQTRSSRERRASRFEPLQTTHLHAVEWHTEEDDALKALLHQRSEELLELVHAPAALAGQGRDLDARVGVVRDEDGVHEHRLGEVPTGLP